MAEINTLPTEGGHWYRKDGSPCYEVPYTDPRKGMRATTLKDARKLDLVPSFSSIKGQLANFGLTNWIQQQILMSAYTCPLSRKDVSAEEWLKKVQEDAKEQGLKARDKGTEIHGIMEVGLQSGKVPESYVVRFGKMVNILMQYGMIDLSEIEAEKSFANIVSGGFWYGGKVDIMSRIRSLIADIKTTEFLMVDGKPNKKLHYPEHILQLSAYGYGVGLASPKAINIYVSTISDDVYVKEWTLNEYVTAWEEFTLLTELWWTKRN